MSVSPNNSLRVVDFTSGIGAGVITTTLLHPLDSIKTIKQGSTTFNKTLIIDSGRKRSKGISHTQKII